jgi:hypothetical protein
MDREKRRGDVAGFGTNREENGEPGQTNKRLNRGKHEIKEEVAK